MTEIFLITSAWMTVGKQMTVDSLCKSRPFLFNLFQKVKLSTNMLQKITGPILSQLDFNVTVGSCVPYLRPLEYYWVFGCPRWPPPAPHCACFWFVFSHLLSASPAPNHSDLFDPVWLRAGSVCHCGCLSNSVCPVLHLTSKGNTFHADSTINFWNRTM